jgi:GWxTD domain-containing protein
MNRTFTIFVIAYLCSATWTYGKTPREMGLEVVRYFPTGKAMLVDAFVEIPMQLMKYEKTEIEIKYRYHISFSVDLFDSKGEQLYHDEWERSDEVEGQFISSERAYIIEPILHVPLDIGGYELRASVQDMNSGNVQEFKREIEDPGESRILSDVVFANSIVQDTTETGQKLDIFRKGNLRINVNCGGKFFGTSSLVFFYYQIRNEEEEPQAFQIDMSILDASGEFVKNLPPRKLLVGPGVRADAGAFSCSGLPLGGYFLRLKMDKPGESGDEESIFVEKSFTVSVREEEVAEEKAKIITRNEFAGFSEAQLDSVFSMMRYILSNSQKKEYKKLNIQGKSNYLNRAWKSLDPIPATEKNEFREELSNRIDYALEEFSTIWKAKRGEESGWAVDDRGVIYIKYGPPDERLIRPNEYGSEPFEIWKYYSTADSYLYLERIRTQGYELIFTNNRDEPYLPNWERYFPPLTLQDIYRELGAAVNR